MAIELPEWSITVFGDPYKSYPALLKEFEGTVAQIIIRGQIAQRRIGRIVLKRIRLGPGEVDIYPRYEDGLNAEATFKLRPSGRTFDTKTVIIWYSPQQWKPTLPPSQLSIPSNLRAFEPAQLRDEILFHELVHSGRLLDGFWPQKGHKLKPDPDKVVPYASEEVAAYDDIEEFVTILVTNIYLSEKGQKVFRASHGGSGYPFILDQAQSSSEGFLTKPSNYGLVKLFCQTDPIAPELAEFDTLFNPVRAFFKKNPQDVKLNKSLQKTPRAALSPGARLPPP